MEFFLSVLGILIVANSAGGCEEGGRGCIDDMIQAFKENSHGQVNCGNYLDISRCTSQKVGESCGKQVEKLYFNELMKEMKNVEPYGSQSLKCVEAIQEAEGFFNKRKRRFVRDIPFAKLML